ncbi:hypothetical protein [Vibrio penaeicida]|uniref:hypothetical protein n=1 Tax=Vibrio penaeicida TaxID=104609 RepID=UPI001CC5A35E|nr:hypothetical protein [Vibrio penaeicida]
MLNHQLGNIDQDYQDSLSSLLLQQGLLTRLEFTKGLIVGLEVEGDDFMAPNTTAALMGDWFPVS